MSVATLVSFIAEKEVNHFIKLFAVDYKESLCQCSTTKILSKLYNEITEVRRQKDNVNCTQDVICHVVSTQKNGSNEIHLSQGSEERRVKLTISQ